MIAIKNNVGHTIKIQDKNNLLTSDIVEALKGVNETIYFNNTSCKYWVFDFKIEGVWFESTNIDMVNNIIELNCYK